MKEENKLKNKILDIIRWIIGGIFLISSLADFNLFGLLFALMLLPINYGFINKTLRIVLAVIGFIGYAVVVEPEQVDTTNEVVAEENETNPTEHTDKEEIKTKEDSINYDDSAVWPNIIGTERGEGYDEYIDKYGVERIKEINALLPKAAKQIRKNKNCDKLISVSLIEDMGSKDNVVIYGACGKHKFYLTEQEINSGAKALTVQEKYEDKIYDYMSLCDERAKSTLTNPSTFKRSISRSTHHIDQHGLTVISGFSAKNDFNLELKYKARCVFNERMEMSVFEIDEER